MLIALERAGEPFVIARRVTMPVAMPAALILVLACAASAQVSLATVPAGNTPIAVAVNPATNKIYVANQNSNNVTVIDGTTYRTGTVPVGALPGSVAVNSVTNMIYVANENGDTVSVINGANNSTATVASGRLPIAVAVNSVTNKIYVANQNSGTATVINGATNTTSSVPVGQSPSAVAVNMTANKIYVVNTGSDTVTIINGATNSTTTVPVAAKPLALAINEYTNKIYIANCVGNSLSIIDGATNSVQTIAVGTTPIAVGVNAATNQIYVANYQSGSVTIVDGTTNETTTVSLATSPNTIAVDAATNKIYVTSFAWTGTVTMIDGADDATTSVAVGIDPTAIALNLPANSLYVTNAGEWDVSVIGGGPSYPLQFVPVVPCRVADTRGPQGPFGAPSLAAGVARAFSVPQSGCNIPDTAMAFSLNVTAVPPPAGRLGYLTIWPTGESEPTISTLNSTDGRIKANAALVPAGADGSVTVYASDSTDLVLDINGYFASASPATLQFYPVAPCRVLDTRNAPGDLGGPSLERNQERDFPVLSSNCQIPPTAQAYSMNITVVPVGGQSLGFLTLWPAGQDQPVVSTLNNPKATVVANAAIVPAGTGGAIAVYPNQNTDLVADINGYFAAPGMGGMSFYPSAPCRVIDTRSTGGAFVGQRTPAVDVVDSSCGIPSAAQAYVFNATVVP